MKVRNIFIIVILLILNINTYPEEKTLDWKTTKEVNEGQSNIPDNVRQDTIQALQDYFYNDLTEELQKRCDFSGDDEGRIYYFAEDNYMTFDKSGSYPNLDTNYDYICIKNLNATGVFDYAYKCSSTVWIMNNTACIRLKIKADISFSENTSNANKTKEYNNDDFNEQIYFLNYNYEQINRVTCDNSYYIDENYPIICTKSFTGSPLDNGKGNYYNYDFDWEDFTKWGKVRYHDTVDHGWVSRKITLEYYMAKSPIPKIKESLKSNFAEWNEETKYNKEINQIPIATDLDVKLLCARFYKDENDDGNYVYDGDVNNGGNNPDIVKYIEGRQTGVDTIILSTDNEDHEDDDPVENWKNIRFQENGKYLMVVCAIDKFNKMYVFEPLKFIIDNEAPYYEGEIKVTDTEYLTDDPVIIDFTDCTITDNMTDYSDTDLNLEEYIYILEKEKINPVSISEYDNLYLDENKLKITEQNKIVNIKNIVIRDKAGNELIIEDASGKSYTWDTQEPEINIIKDKEYLNANDVLKIEIEEPLDITINSIYLDSSQVTDTDYYHYESRTDDIILIGLNDYKDTEGTIILNVDIEDAAGNRTNHNENINFDDVKPVMNAEINNNVLTDYYRINNNNHVTINYQVNDNNFDRIEFEIDSNSTLRQNLLSYGTANGSALFEKQSDVTEENIKLNIIAYDKAENSVLIKGIKINLVSDDNAPEVIATQDLDNSWRYLVEVFNNEEDSILKNVYYKQIESAVQGDATINDFGSLPPDAQDWIIIGQNISYFCKEYDILPGHAVCIMADDVFGNMSDYVILENPASIVTIIDQEYIDNNPLPWVLSGEVIIDTDIIINTGETLTITSDTLTPTILRFKSSEDKYEIINQGGTINIDSTFNTITFNGLGENEDDYTWLGIINESGNIEFTGDNKIYFKDAVSPIVIVDPEDDITLSMAEFKDCKMGIHFIDDSGSFNTLNIDNMTFINTVYCIKFDFSNNTDKLTYSNNYPYLTESNIVVDNITRSQVYCPVNGLVNFSNFNEAPDAESLIITGTPQTGEILTINYTYTDDDTQDPAATKYQWYISTNKPGPYKAIADATGDNWTVEPGNSSSWIRASVLPVDINGAKGNYSLSKPVKIINQPPSAQSLIIEVTPARDTGTAKLGDELKAGFDYSDIDKDPEGNHLYQWYWTDSQSGPFDETGNLITGNEIETYYPDLIDYVGKYIYCSVTPVDLKGAEGNTIYSQALLMDTPDMPEVDSLEIHGTPEDGNTLTVVYNTTPAGYPENNFTYKWYISDIQNADYPDLTELSGYTGRECIIVSSFEGKWIYFEVTPANVLNTGSSVLSDPVYINYKLPYAEDVNISLPAGEAPIPGTVLTGEYEYYDPYDLNPDGTTFKWYVSDDNTTYTEISGETGQQLTLNEADFETIYEGKYVKFEVTVKNTESRTGKPVTSEPIQVYKKIYAGDTALFTETGVTHQWCLDEEFGQELQEVTATITAIAGGGGGGGGGSGFQKYDYYEYRGGGGGGGAGDKASITVDIDSSEALYVIVGNGGNRGNRGEVDNKRSDGEAGENGGNGGYSVVSQINDILKVNGGSGGKGGDCEYDTETSEGETEVSYYEIIAGNGGSSPSSNSQASGKNGNNENGGDGGINTDENIVPQGAENDDDAWGEDGENALTGTGSGGGGGGGGGISNSYTRHGGYGGYGGSGIVIIEWSGWYWGYSGE